MASVFKNLARNHGASQNHRVRIDAEVGQPTSGHHRNLLETTYEALSTERPEPSRVQQALDELFVGLQTRKLSSTPQEWRSFVDACRRHPVAELIHQDPFTHRAFSKPRGYAGDAELLDYIYGREEQWLPPAATSTGQHIFDYTTLAPASEGVRARRGFIAELIDRLAEERRHPHVLSIAAGHLREACLSSAVKRRKLGRFVALDADASSLQEVNHCYSCYGVETVCGSIRQLLANRLELGSFDLIYSTGLFDYLEQPVARRLVSNMFQMLRPGGQLLVANFMPGIRDAGYMEAFMDWNLVYRTRQEMMDIAAEIAQPTIRHISLFAEENQNIIFVQITKV